MNGLFKLLPNENALFRNHGQILMDIYKHNPEARSTQAAGVSQVPAIITALVTEALRYRRAAAHLLVLPRLLPSLQLKVNVAWGGMKCKPVHYVAY